MLTDTVVYSHYLDLVPLAMPDVSPTNLALSIQEARAFEQWFEGQEAVDQRESNGFNAH